MITKKICLSLCLTLLFAQTVLAHESSHWHEFFKAGSDAFAANNYGVAEKNFLMAYEEGQQFGMADLRLAKTAKELATLYSVRGQFAKAESWLEKELRIKEKALGSTNSEVISLVGNIDKFYLLHSKAEKSNRLTKLLSSYADKLLQEKNGKSTQFLELAANLDGIANIYKGRSKFSEAGILYEKAMKLRQSGLPAEHMAQVFSYENMGNLYADQGKYSEAEPYFEKALHLTEKILEPKRSEIITCTNNLAKCDISLGKYKEAEFLYKNALTRLTMAKGPKSGNIGVCSYELACLYIKEGKYALAEPLLRKALAIAEANNGPAHYSLLPIIDNYVNVLEKMKHTGEASRMKARLKSISGLSVVENVNSQTF